MTEGNVSVFLQPRSQRRFGNDPSVVGEIVKVNGQPCTIVGVVPPEFVGTLRGPLTLVSVEPIFGCVALIACAVSARRAAGVNPAVALRSE